ncbi:hypothetical protein [Bacillus cereus]|nr:hypothetical protein [Bacillus cereus]
MRKTFFIVIVLFLSVFCLDPKNVPPEVLPEMAGVVNKEEEPP